MYCTHCGGPIGRSAASCPACGRPVGAVPGGDPPQGSSAGTRWRPPGEPKAEPPSGLKGKLLWMLGGDRPREPIKPPEPEPIPDEPSSLRPGFAPPDTNVTEKLTRELTPVNRTVAGFGLDMAKLKTPARPRLLQVFDATGQWLDWGVIPPHGMTVGRGKTSDQVPALASLAARHFRLSFDESSHLTAEDLGTLNGLYRKVVGPTPLVDGVRFRAGNFVLAYRTAEAAAPVKVQSSGDGEAFGARDLMALAYVDLIRPDGSAGVRVPVLRPEGLILGRDPKEADLALPDAAVSTRHAQIRRHEATDGFLIEDLGSRNGTYLSLGGKTPVAEGDILLAGQVLFRIVQAGA